MHTRPRAHTIMRVRHICFHPLLDCIGGDAHGAANADHGQFATLYQAPDGANREAAELAGGLIQVPEQRVGHATRPAAPAQTVEGIRSK